MIGGHTVCATLVELRAAQAQSAMPGASNAVLWTAAGAGAGFIAYNQYCQKQLDREAREEREERAKRSQDHKERMEHQRQKEGVEAEMRNNVKYTMAKEK